MNSERLKIKRQRYTVTTPIKKKAGVVILISDKIDLKAKSITRNKEGHLIMIKRIISTGGYNNTKFLRNEHFKTREAGINKTEEIDNHNPAPLPVPYRQQQNP